MFSPRNSLPLLVGLVSLLTAAIASAQQVTIRVPQQSISSGYYEYIGSRWVYFGPGFGFSFGGQPLPTYGGFNPNAGLDGGFPFGSGGTGGQFNFSAVAGGSTAFTTTTPMLTVTNGVPGSITAGQFTPFVTGISPVLGGGLATNPAFNNLGASNSILGRIQRGEIHIRDGQVMAGPDPLLSLAPELEAPPILFPRDDTNDHPQVAPVIDEVQVRHRAQLETTAALQQQAVDSDANAKAQELFAKGQRLESKGKTGAAKLLYQTAVQQATGVLQDEIATHLQSLP
ncbi:MAG: hypothetical protein ACK5Q5_02035 [Planctomycetaceae bacterium]